MLHTAGHSFVRLEITQSVPPALNGGKRGTKQEDVHSLVRCPCVGLIIIALLLRSRCVAAASVAVVVVAVLFLFLVSRRDRMCWLV